MIKLPEVLINNLTHADYTITKTVGKRLVMAVMPRGVGRVVVTVPVDDERAPVFVYLIDEYSGLVADVPEVRVQDSILTIEVDLPVEECYLKLEF